MEWNRGPTIGRGATATVSLATTPSGELFAVKSADLSRSLFLQKEQQFLSKLSSPHIVGYLGYDITSENNKLTYNLFMEYVHGGTVHDAIQNHGGRLDEPTIQLYTRQILQGLDYLHLNGLAHCDIKSRNVIVGIDGVKIADLGCAKLVDNVAGNEVSGTPVFMAPEVARGEDQSFAADVWAVGCTVIEMATGSTPWPEVNDPISALYRIGFSGDRPEIPGWLSEEAKDFLCKCLIKNPKERWTAKELLEHPFVKEVKGFTMNSPNCVLDQGMWDSFGAPESPHENVSSSSSNSSADERIKRLVSEEPNWDCDENWITVRSRTHEFADKNNVISAYGQSISNAEVTGTIVLEEELESTTIDEDLLSEIFVENIFTIVRDDSVLRDLRFETDNKNFGIQHFLR